MLGVIVNTLAVICGSIIGLLCKRGIPRKASSAIMKSLGLCSIAIGISGVLKGADTLILIASMVLGTWLGTALDLDGKIGWLGNWAEKKLRTGGKSISQGFVNASILFCVGSMTVVGSLNAGIAGDNELLFTKSILDLFSSIMLAASMGIGVMYSSVFVFLFEGTLVLLSSLLTPILTQAAIGEMVCAGSVMILGVGLNLLEITQLKVADFLPALVFAPLFSWICTLI